MSLCKLIVRFDFSRPCFAMLDKAGTLMADLANLTDIKVNSDRFFFDTIQENALQREMWAIRENDGVYSKIHVSPKFVLLDFEIGHGVELRQLQTQDHVQRMLQFLHHILTNFQVTHIARGGARFVYLGKAVSDSGAVDFGSLFAAPFHGFMKNMSAAERDYGIAINGQQNDKINYRLVLGPFTESDGPRFFQYIPKVIVARNEDKNYLVDLDLYEADFVLRVNPTKWLAPLIDSTSEVVASFAGLLGKGKTNDNVNFG